ncbi:class I SAM-dependent methyltransferase [Spirosoma validum]|uniref:Methyltransferase domain-containing protein n=1 Tax=Spirosoma validum TaxID=2771355 RepID=A0A927GE33_9BACT|nr:class I SAM-dependent methyltransferase [Spirosoma validum]MBD2754195.1 methyltransferase domain-containing protein [Spirosoma validum]
MNWNTDLYTQKHSFVYQYGEGLLELLNPRPHERILDLGCGSGELTQRIAESGAQVIGIDSSATMLNKAQAQFPTLTVHQMDATNFSFDDPFDAIFSNAVLHWVPDYEATVRQMAKALKPGGRLVLEFGGKNNVATIVNAVARQLEKFGYSFTPFWFFPSIGEYTPVLEQYGFKVRLAQHYDRDTLLNDPETGLADWIEQFGPYFFKNVASADKAAILEAINDDLRPALFRDGRWYADYKRIRIVAEKT